MHKGRAAHVEKASRISGVHRASVIDLQQADWAGS
jgi:hypothetical protein